MALRAPAEFWRYVQRTQTCWLWTGPTAAGYARFWNGERTVFAHRWAYELEIGEIPARLRLVQRCDSRGCVRPGPDHHTLETAAASAASMTAKGHLATAVVSSYGIGGVQSEPRAGYHRLDARDRALEAFCAAAWQRAGHGGHRPNPRMWPTTGSFHANWPLIANDLIVGDWKIAGAESLTETAEIDEALLDPPPVQDRDWRDVFAAELASHPAILEDLEKGAKMDGVELVLERAGLTTSERAVIRSWLAGDNAATIAEQLGWRPHMVATLLHTGCWRLKDVASWSRPRALGRKVLKAEAAVSTSQPVGALATA
jgi:hypothetical protein